MREQGGRGQPADPRHLWHADSDRGHEPDRRRTQFYRRYIDGANHEALVRRIRHAFDRACWEKDFTLIEGTGHAGVGSVFDLSNAKVAGVLDAKVLLITPGGIGRPIDEAALNMALFDKAGVEVIGVVMNKVLPQKLEEIAEVAQGVQEARS